MNNQLSKDEALTKSFRFQNRELLDNYVVLAVTDTKGAIQHVSTNLCRIFSYKPSELIDKSYHILISKDSLKSFETQFNDANITKATYKGEIKHSSSSGNVIWTDTIIEPLFDDDKNHIGFIFASNDITQEKRLKKINEENLLQKNYDSSILDFMPNVSAAVLLRTSSSLHKILWIIFMGVLVFLIWAYFSKIDDIVKTNGKIVTTSNIQNISSLEGGVLKNIYVNEGDYVKKGDLILQISDIAYKSEYDKKFYELMSLTAKIERLQAQVQDRQIKPIKKVVAFDKNIMKNEINFFNTSKQKLKIEKDILKEQLIQKQNELKDSQEKLDILRKNHTILKDELEDKRSLVKSRIISKSEFLKLQREFNDIDIELKNTIGSIPTLKSKIKELTTTINEAKLKFMNDSENELIEIYSKKHALNEELNSLEDKIKRASIKAPSNGLVKKINIETIGEAISPGVVILEIVPDSDFVLAEVQVKPSDIGFLYIGQPVKIKLRAYDFSLYGGVMGEIKYISPDTILDPATNEEYYIVNIKSKVKYVDNNENLKIKAGMTVDADIITGKKTILEFILKPVIKTLQL